MSTHTDIQTKQFNEYMREKKEDREIMEVVPVIPSEALNPVEAHTSSQTPRTNIKKKKRKKKEASSRVLDLD